MQLLVIYAVRLIHLSRPVSAAISFKFPPERFGGRLVAQMLRNLASLRQGLGLEGFFCLRRVWVGDVFLARHGMLV